MSKLIKFSRVQRSPTVTYVYAGEEHVGTITKHDEHDWSGTCLYPQLSWVTGKDSLEAVQSEIQERLIDFLKRIAKQ